MWIPKLLAVVQLLVAVMAEFASIVDIGPYRHTLITQHNHYRKKIEATKMKEMVWDEGLSNAAETWSVPCKYGVFDEQLGQNMYYETNKDPSKDMIKAAVKIWKYEASDIINPKGICKGDCSKAQILWDNSTSFGCALRQCPSLDLGSGKVVNHATFLVCLYWPKVKKDLKEMFTPGEGCSNCDEGFVCKKGLCSSETNFTLPYRETLAKKLLRPPQFHQKSLRRMMSDGTKRSRRQLANGGSLTNTEEYYVLSAHNTMRRRTEKPELKWSEYLSRWANYVIRCNIEYPGPRSAYTNFGKMKIANREDNNPIYQVVFEWGNEGYDVDREMESGCRTPFDREQCNHNTNIMVNDIADVGCASLDCQNFKQLTCIYK